MKKVYICKEKDSLKSAIIRESVGGVLNNIESTKIESGYYKNLKVPTIQSGKEKQFFNIGDICFTTGGGLYKQGIECKVLAVYNENGYYRYQVIFNNGAKSIERQKDLTSQRLQLAKQLGMIK